VELGGESWEFPTNVGKQKGVRDDANALRCACHGTLGKF
jgi:hypothetical protein